MPKPKPLKHVSPVSRAHLSIFILIFVAIGGVAIWRSLAASNPNLPGDLNNDNTVNVTDLSILLSNYGTANPTADINSDGTVNILDLSALLSHYGQSVSSTPSIPTGLAATPGDSKVTLNWTANPSSESVDTYQVYWTTDSTWNTGINQNLSIAGTSYTVSGLSNGTVYYFRVSAHNISGYGGWSNPVSATPQGTVGSGIMHPTNRLGLWHLGSSLTGLSNLSSYGVIAVSADGASQAKPLPGLTLIYSNASQIVSAYTEGLSYSIASANGCLLGQFQTGRYVFDHTKSACNQLEADADLAYVKQVGLKGMFLDDVLPQNPYGYTTPSGWRQGMIDFVHLLHQELNANGFYLLTNTNAFSDPTLGNGDDGTGDLAWAKLIKPDGIMEEDWEETRDTTQRLRPIGANWDQHWDSWQTVAAGVQAAGMDFIGLSYNPNVAYTYASLLLQDAGHAVYIHATTDGSDPWSSLFSIDLGAPAGSVVQSGAGYWRQFSKGQAIINPSPTSSVTINGHTLQLTTAYVGP